jgi:hypothetical protein
MWINSAVASNVAQRSNHDWRGWATVGQAQLSVLFFDIYQSELLSPNGGYSVEKDITPHPLALSITYQRDISQQQLLDATVEQWQKLGFKGSETSQWADTLSSIFPDIEEGHNITYVTNGQQGQFFHADEVSNAKLIGVIEDEAFNDAFLAIWLSPNTDYPKLRQGLIGNNR